MMQFIFKKSFYFFKFIQKIENLHNLFYAVCPSFSTKQAEQSSRASRLQTRNNSTLLLVTPLRRARSLLLHFSPPARHAALLRHPVTPLFCVTLVTGTFDQFGRRSHTLLITLVQAFSPQYSVPFTTITAALCTFPPAPTCTRSLIGDCFRLFDRFACAAKSAVFSALLLHSFHHDWKRRVALNQVASVDQIFAVFAFCKLALHVSDVSTRALELVATATAGVPPHPEPARHAATSLLPLTPPLRLLVLFLLFFIAQSTCFLAVFNRPRRCTNWEETNPPVNTTIDNDLLISVRKAAKQV